MKEIRDTAETGADIGGVGETVAFTIEDSPEMIRRQIAHLYSQGAKTVVRELIANAIDSHVAAGIENTVPISVYLPTTFDPSLAVRDFGVGMSHDFVMRLYSRIGHSSKSGSNRETGMFGVGSKSPLAISDTFSIRCYDKPGFNGSELIATINGKTVDLNKSGRVRLYTVFFDANGAPKISHTFNVEARPEDKVELGGVQVKVPISSAQRPLVLDGVASQHFVWFDKNISFEGSFTEVSSRFYSAIVQVTPGLYFASPTKGQTASWSSSNWSVFVRQGAAIYPLEEGSISPHIPDDIRKMMRNISESGRHIMFDVPIGTTNVTPAREAIRYEPHTLPALAKFVKDKFEIFRAEIASHVGDAASHREALKKLAAKYLDPKDVNNLAALRTITPFLSYVNKTLEANYDKKFATLPDVPKSVVKRDANDNPERDANGALVYETKMVRPTRHAPSSTVWLTKGEFPEGKVLMHNGKLYGGTVGQLYIKDTVVDELGFQVPNVVYVIPNHLQKWQDRLRKHASTAFADHRLPDTEYNGIHVYIIRCAKRNMDGVIAAMESRAVSWKVFTTEDMPDVDTAVARQRNFSKTSVYEWNHSTESWNDTKIEPDYSKEAYYVSRVGISHEVFTHNPLKAPGTSPGTAGFTLRPRISGYDMGRIVRAARKLKLIADDAKIYRVTENQAPKIANTCPEWKHFTTFLALETEKLIRTDSRVALTNSTLGGTSNDYGVQQWVRLGKEAGKNSPENHKVALAHLQRIAAVDPLFRTVVGTRVALTAQRNGSLTAPRADSDRDGQIRELNSGLFGSNPNYAREETNAYNALVEEFTRRYDFMCRLLGSSAYGNADAARHIGFYLEGFVKDLKLKVAAKPFDAAKFPIIEPYAKDFQETLDKRYVEVYGTPPVS